MDLQNRSHDESPKKELPTTREEREIVMDRERDQRTNSAQQRSSQHTRERANRSRASSKTPQKRRGDHYKPNHGKRKVDRRRSSDASTSYAMSEMSSTSTLRGSRSTESLASNVGYRSDVSVASGTRRPRPMHPQPPQLCRVSYGGDESALQEEPAIVFTRRDLDREGYPPLPNHLSPGAIIWAPHYEDRLDPNFWPHDDTCVWTIIGDVCAKMRFFVVHIPFPTHVLAFPIYSNGGKGIKRIPDDEVRQWIRIKLPNNPREPPVKADGEYSPLVVGKRLSTLVPPKPWEPKPNSFVHMANLVMTAMYSKNAYYVGELDEGSALKLELHCGKLFADAKQTSRESRQARRANASPSAVLAIVRDLMGGAGISSTVSGTAAYDPRPEMPSFQTRGLLSASLPPKPPPALDTPTPAAKLVRTSATGSNDTRGRSTSRLSSTNSASVIAKRKRSTSNDGSRAPDTKRVNRKKDDVMEELEDGEVDEESEERHLDPLDNWKSAWDKGNFEYRPDKRG